MKTPKNPSRLVPLLRDLHPHENYPVQLTGREGSDNAILVSRFFVVEPKVLEDMILPQYLTMEELESLSDAIGHSLSIKVQESLGEAIRWFIIRVALSNKIVPWKEYAHQFRAITKAVKLLLTSIDAQEFATQTHSYLSPAFAIEKFLETRGIDAATLETLSVDCEEQLKQLQLAASKRGVKADKSVQLFMEAVVSAAIESGVELIVGGHKTKQNLDDEILFIEHDTPLLVFARRMLNYARDHAPDAFSQSHGLTAEDRKAALRRFDEIMQKDGRALQHQLEVAIDTLAATFRV